VQGDTVPIQYSPEGGGKERMMYIINRVFGIGCALFANILNQCMPDGEVKHILLGAVIGAGFIAMLNIIMEKE
jgi:hypothetical protein